MEGSGWKPGIMGLGSAMFSASAEDAVRNRATSVVQSSLFLFILEQLLDFFVGFVEGVAAEGDEFLCASELGGKLVDAELAGFNLADDFVELLYGLFVSHFIKLGIRNYVLRTMKNEE